MTTQQNQNIAPAPTTATTPASEIKVAVNSTGANKAKDLADEIYRQSPKGSAEWSRNWNRHPEATRPLPAEFFTWRARCYANVSRQFESQPDFPQLLAEWERGFDSIASEADAPAPSRHEIIKRIVGQANAVAALLSVVDAMPIIDQHDALYICAGLADGIAADVSTLARGTL